MFRGKLDYFLISLVLLFSATLFFAIELGLGFQLLLITVLRIELVFENWKILYAFEKIKIKLVSLEFLFTF